MVELIVSSKTYQQNSIGTRELWQTDGTALGTKLVA